MKRKIVKGWIRLCQFNSLFELYETSNGHTVWDTDVAGPRKNDFSTGPCKCKKLCKPTRITLEARIE